jgi:hypothetical protein
MTPFMDLFRHYEGLSCESSEVDILAPGLRAIM